MSTFTLIRRAAIGAALTVVASASAFAQSTILVVDTTKAFDESAVGQHIARQIESMANTTSTQLNAQVSPLEAQKKNLELQTDGKSQEQVLQDAALVSQIQNFQRNAVKLRQDTAVAQRELQLTEQKARQLVSAKMKTIIDQIAKERNADVVLEKQLVIYGEPADITSTVLSRLNAQMTTVPVTRVRMPQTQTGS